MPRTDSLASTGRTKIVRMPRRLLPPDWDSLSDDDLLNGCMYLPPLE